jgi:tetratricopeptide (TPR) repeat protein
VTKSLKYCQKSLAIWEKLHKGKPDSLISIGGLTESLADLGRVYVILGDLDNALSYYMLSLDKAEAIHKRDPIFYSSKLSNIGYSIGNIYLRKKEAEKAVTYYQNSINLIEVICKAPDESQSHLPFLCMAYTGLGNAFLDLGKLQNAHKLCLSIVKFIF